MIYTHNVTFNDNLTYSLFNLNIGVVIRELVDRIIKTLNITDRVDNKQADGQVDSDVKLTLDTIVVKVPASPELGNYNIEEP